MQSGRNMEDIIYGIGRWKAHFSRGFKIKNK